MSQKKKITASFVFNHGCLLFWCAFIYFLSSQSSLAETPNFLPYQDKIAHTLMYACLAFLSCMSFRHGLKTPKTIVLLSGLFCVIYGISDEWHQSFVAQRMPDLWDWYADSLGAAMMCAWLYFVFPQMLVSNNR